MLTHSAAWRRRQGHRPMPTMPEKERVLLEAPFSGTISPWLGLLGPVEHIGILRRGGVGGGGEVGVKCLKDVNLHSIRLCTSCSVESQS